MNKTVNINLANMLFHIDDKAYNKLQRYLESVKRSFAGTSGSEEIIADIEARVAELFHEKMENDRQVITEKEVDEVISTMGQPEDYMVDEDIFEDEPQPRQTTTTGRVKKLYRDMEHKYIGGVCSGLEHYLGFDALWIRLIFLAFGIFTGFGFIAYILLWILVPEASTTSQKLDMSGKPINISNIERKVKEGFDDVADRVKNVDYEGMGNKVKSGGKSFFDTVGDIFLFLFKVFGKFIGIIMIITGAATLVGLFVGLITVGTLDWAHIPGFDNVIMNSLNAPIWLVSLLIFFAIGIPFFFLLYLGLKILISNLKSIGNIAKFSLLGLWLISIATLIILGVREAASHAYSGSVTTENELYISNADTLNIALASSEYWENGGNIRMNDMIITYNEDGNRILLSDDIRFRFKKSRDSVIHIEVRKEANGSSYNDARDTAEKINYEYALEGNTLVLNNFLTTIEESRFNDQEARVNIYLPEGMTLSFNQTNNCNWSTDNDRNINRCHIDDYIWKMGEDGELKCQDCPETSGKDWNDDDDGNKIIINEDGIDINIQDGDDSFEMKIDEDGVKIKAGDNN
ncbi:MAG: hypothetical protein COA50_07045 [Flavobacteriaceae bacterium]|nr:MAG: hypothetical protein COA50_07045 [Flavobacteriaceae bacterium]